MEKMIVDLPSEVIVLMQDAVHSGEYASSSEIMGEALHEWSRRRHTGENANELRRLWQEGLARRDISVDPDEVFDRLRAKYEALAEMTDRNR